ncbi:MAG: hypothetical protein AB3X44_11935 [Leptothrix sp. (in: b-proteobacteria)]
MFGNFFKKKLATDHHHEKEPDNKSDLIFETMMTAINEKRKVDPLIGAKIGSKEIVQHLIAALRTDKGVHIESLLSALGALAGYACQASIRAELIEAKGVAENAVFAVANCVDGRKYYFGDLLNKPLAESQYSVWSLAAGAAQQLGVKDMLDLEGVFGYVTDSIGGENFGVPRIPEGHTPSDLPINFLKIHWPKLMPLIRRFCAQPSEWPVLFGLAIQEVLYMGQGTIDPAVALSIAMESAIPMSKVDLEAF